MVVCRFVELTEEKINCFKENAYFFINTYIIVLKQLFISGSLNMVSVFIPAPIFTSPSANNC